MSRVAYDNPDYTRKLTVRTFE